MRWRALVCACSRAGAVGTGLAVVTRRSRACRWHGTCRDAARVGRERPGGATPSPPLHPKGEKWSLSFQVYSPLYAKCGLVYHVHIMKQILFVVWLLACLVGFALFTLGVAVFFVRQGLSVFGL